MDVATVGSTGLGRWTRPARAETLPCPPSDRVAAENRVVVQPQRCLRYHACTQRTSDPGTKDDSRSDPRKGPAPRRDSARGGRRDADQILDRDTTADTRPIVVLAEDDPAALDGLSLWLAGEGFLV